MKRVDKRLDCIESRLSLLENKFTFKNAIYYEHDEDKKNIEELIFYKKEILTFIGVKDLEHLKEILDFDTYDHDLPNYDEKRKEKNRVTALWDEALEEYNLYEEQGFQLLSIPDNATWNNENDVTYQLLIDALNSTEE